MSPTVRDARIRLRHRYVHGLGFSLCVMCDNDVGPCWGGQISGYASCAACHKSSGPAERDCAVALLPDYLAATDARGRAPAFSVRGPIELRARLVDWRSQEPRPGVTVVLGFPNGLALSTRTDERGRFRLRVESTEDAPLEAIDLGTVAHRGGRNRRFRLGFSLQGVAPRQPDKIDAPK